MIDDDASVFFLSERTYYILKESIWSSSGSDRIQLEAASSRYSRKISKNFKKQRASGAHTMRCVHFLNLQCISLFPVSCHFKEQKDEIGRKWCRTFETNLRFTLLKKLDISKIAVLKEFTFKTGF